MVTRLLPLLSALLLLSLLGCAGSRSASPASAAPARPLPEAWRSRDFPVEQLTSVALWPGNASNKPLAYATAQATGHIYGCDARTGDLREVLDGFAAPSGIAVVDDLLLVVERDLRRVRVLSLPGHEDVLAFGQDVLIAPTELAAFRDHDGTVLLYVADAYDPRRHDVGQRERLKQFLLHPPKSQGAPWTAQLARIFGDPVGEGAIAQPGPLALDPDKGRLWIADQAAGQVKLYGLDGRHQGATVGNGMLFEGIGALALLPNGDSEPQLLVAEQGRDGAPSPLRLFTRDGRHLLSTVQARPLINVAGATTALIGDDPWLAAVHDRVRLQGYRASDLRKAAR